MEMYNYIFEETDEKKLSSVEKINCWEFNQCGREKGGINVPIHGVCPVPYLHALDGVNGGKNAGRYCWSITNNGYRNQKDICLYVKKYNNCLECPYYQMVQKEEGKDFIS
jgi:hypothetical protein